ncbi:hypothetical protein J4408_03310 [Candidatus Pacearchaeota archaeon]|nr:hypothetical protein [Candidatus Pacearchaeota archaeon]
MGLKTFNLKEEIYKEFSEHCKKEGISMSKKVERFIKEETVRLKSKTIDKKEGNDIIKVSDENSFKKYC